MTPPPISRRTLVTGAAWSVPVIALSVATPAAAAASGMATASFDAPTYTVDFTRLLSGVVVRVTKDGAPLAGAVVTVSLSAGMTFTPGGTTSLPVTTGADGSAQLPDIELAETTASGTLSATSVGVTPASAAVTSSVRKLVWVTQPAAPQDGQSNKITKSGVGVRLLRVDDTSAGAGEVVTFMIPRGPARWKDYVGPTVQTRTTDATGLAVSDVLFTTGFFSEYDITVAVSHPYAPTISYDLPYESGVVVVTPSTVSFDAPTYTVDSSRLLSGVVVRVSRDGAPSSGDVVTVSLSAGMTFTPGGATSILVTTGADGSAPLPGIELGETTASGTLSGSAAETFPASATITSSVRKLVWVTQPAAPQDGQTNKITKSGVGVRLLRVDGTSAGAGEIVTLMITRGPARWRDYVGPTVQTRTTDATGLAVSDVLFTTGYFSPYDITVAVSHPQAPTISYDLPYDSGEGGGIITIG
ncbi:MULTISPECIES: hypothetical protein [unclassified Microbacterium]|uniref:hypothetical protein n=1 Tax=unclassified Microbacterium TaxID=2609290 RepID=UPI0008928F0C|nr:MULTISPECIES: hypothetical protein [unclassified Microbacterium]AOX45644.1 hypothetical protein BJP65_07355 [Microbacterium sp. BH-3-3-3]MBD8217060.1 hypothetical protein [Microbacterium sp. CFBP 13617]